MKTRRVCSIDVVKKYGRDEAGNRAVMYATIFTRSVDGQQYGRDGEVEVVSKIFIGERHARRIERLFGEQSDPFEGAPDWDNAPDWAQFWAYNANGLSCWYEERPIVSDTLYNAWEVQGGARHALDDEPFFPDWKESLVEWPLPQPDEQDERPFIAGHPENGWTL